MRAYRAFSQAPWLEKAYVDLQEFLLGDLPPEEPKGKLRPEVSASRQQQIESERAISNFCETCHATRVTPSRTELEEVWGACRGLTARHVASRLAFEICSAEDWRPRLRVLHFVQFLQHQGGAAAVVADETLSEIEEFLHYLSKEVPQCRAVACQLLSSSIFRDMEEVPHERSTHLAVRQVPCADHLLGKSVDEACPSRSSSMASSETDVPADVPEGKRFDIDEARPDAELPEVVPALPPPTMLCPAMKVAASLLPDAPVGVPEIAEEGGFQDGKGSAEVMDAALQAPELAEEGTFRDGAGADEVPSLRRGEGIPAAEEDQDVPEEHVPPAQRPYLWLAAVGTLQMESVQDPFAEFALPTRHLRQISV